MIFETAINIVIGIIMIGMTVFVVMRDQLNQ